MTPEQKNTIQGYFADEYARGYTTGYKHGHGHRTEELEAIRVKLEERNNQIAVIDNDRKAALARVAHLNEQIKNQVQSIDMGTFAPYSLYPLFNDRKDATKLKYTPIAFDPKLKSAESADRVDELRRLLEASTQKELGDLRLTNGRLQHELREAKQRLEKLSRLATQLEGAQQTVVNDREALTKQLAALHKDRDAANQRARDAEAARDTLPDVIVQAEDGIVNFTTEPVRFNGDTYQVQSIDIDRKREVSSITYVRAEGADE